MSIVSYVEQKSKKETPARERRFPPSSPFTDPHQTGTHQHSNNNTKTQDGVVAADVGDLRRLCSAYPKVQNYMIYVMYSILLIKSTLPHLIQSNKTLPSPTFLKKNNNPNRPPQHKVKFLATFLARVSQHEAAVLANKFPNLHLYGCWWYCNNPSIIREVKVYVYMYVCMWICVWVLSRVGMGVDCGCGVSVHACARVPPRPAPK